MPLCLAIQKDYSFKPGCQCLALSKKFSKVRKLNQKLGLFSFLLEKKFNHWRKRLFHWRRDFL